MDPVRIGVVGCGSAYHVTEIMVRAEESATDGRARQAFPDLAFDAETIDVERTKRHGRLLWGLDDALGQVWGTMAARTGVR